MSEIEKYYNGEIHVDFDKETIKITQPMFEPGELESFDNYIHSIVEEYSKMKLHEKDQILTQRIIMKQEEEIEKLKEENNNLKFTPKTRFKDIIELRDENKQLKSIIKEVREYIENNSLYEQDYDYDYEENLYEYPPSDEQARKDILSILDKEKE